MGASAGGFMSRRYNVNMAEYYSYFSNFEGKYLENYLKLVHQNLYVSSYYRNLLFETVLFPGWSSPLKENAKDVSEQS